MGDSINQKLRTLDETSRTPGQSLTLAKCFANDGKVSQSVEENEKVPKRKKEGGSRSSGEDPDRHCIWTSLVARRAQNRKFAPLMDPPHCRSRAHSSSTNYFCFHFQPRSRVRAAFPPSSVVCLGAKLICSSVQSRIIRHNLAE
jgi:hypothetical protein